ncbi:hypothetical protein Nepgr_023246 [Nepenthes gracilis]|uniref:NAC domain-containing protein n=1 Tax=Nepenthes gracilis TaxID=150966 RepID=A0AAD3XYV2_NEPGR|nr:hypothetical protein Nepgr_023246 [Nepenthes gracilis]
MENVSGYLGVEETMDLPPGFRFHPTDEELITHYLLPKVLDSNFSARAMGEVDLNKSEPWELPRRAKMGEEECYFFCVRDRKYPTGLRTNRATDAGYWKATGKDKAIFRGKSLVGMKKILVFYRGRAPKGHKSNWVIHEYRLEGKFNLQNLPTTAKNEWVICRVFRKSGGEKKIHYPGPMVSESFSTQFDPSALAPLMESSPYSHQTKPGALRSVNVSCFSRPTSSNSQGSHEQVFNSFSNDPYYFQRNIATISNHPSENAQIPGSFMSEEAILRAILDNNYNNNENRTEMKWNMKTERDLVSLSQDTCLTSDVNAEISSVYEIGKEAFDGQEGPSTSGEPVDADSFWNCLN